ncbi:MAG: hypothetical protein IJ740_06965 [Ruminococcus sp.]|nr:hypothetical protein [Ruminococcus sp.]
MIISKMFKRALSLTLAAAMALSFAAVSKPETGTAVITAQAASGGVSGSKLSSNAILAQACKLIGRKYQMGGKGYNYASHTFSPASGVTSVDCSGLVYWTLGTLGVRAKSPITFYGVSVPLPLNVWDWYRPDVWYTNYGKLTYKGDDFTMKRLRANSASDYIPTKDKSKLAEQQSYWLERTADGKLTGGTITPGCVITARNKNRSGGGYDHAFFYMGEFGSKKQVKNYLKNVLGVDVPDKYVIEAKNNMADGTTSTHWKIESAGGSGPDGFYGVYINNGVTDSFGTYSFEAFSLTGEDSLLIKDYIDGGKLGDSQKNYTYYTVKSGGMYMKARASGIQGDDEYTFAGWTSDKNYATRFKNREYSSGSFGAKINRIPHTDRSLTVTLHRTDKGKAEGLRAAPDGVSVYCKGTADITLGGYDKTGKFNDKNTLDGASWQSGQRYVSKIRFDYTKTSADPKKICVDFNSSIKQKGNASHISNCYINLSTRTFEYTGTELAPKVKVISDNAYLKRGKDYSLKLENNLRMGKATVTIKGKGDYTGSVKKTFKITPKKTTVKTLTPGKKGTFKITVGERKTAEKYEITYSTNEKFTGKTTGTVTTKYTHKTIKGLKAGKTYYVRVRTVRVKKGTTLYSPYSKVKTVKTKKK